MTTGVKHVEGRNAGNLMLYALSTCVWCKRTKGLLDELGVEYDYVYVDQLAGEAREKAREELTKWNPKRSFPTLVVNGEKPIVGYDENGIREALKP